MGTKFRADACSARSARQSSVGTAADDFLEICPAAWLIFGSRWAASMKTPPSRAVGKLLSGLFGFFTSSGSCRGSCLFHGLGPKLRQSGDQQRFSLYQILFHL